MKRATIASAFVTVALLITGTAVQAAASEALVIGGCTAAVTAMTYAVMYPPKLAPLSLAEKIVIGKKLLQMMYHYDEAQKKYVKSLAGKAFIAVLGARKYILTLPAQHQRLLAARL